MASWQLDAAEQQALDILCRQTIGVMEYARTVVLPDGDFGGATYDPSRHQAQEVTLRAIDAGAGWVAILKPVQDGGSLASFVPLLRRAHALGQNAIVAYPTMDAAKDAWSKKVWPMLEKQGGTQPKKGGGSRGGAARVVQLPSGGSIILRAAGGRGESGQASVTADAMLVDEVDDWADMRVLRLIERRLHCSRDPLIIYVSTCKRDAETGVEQSRIVRLYQQGTQTRLHYPCPHCGHRFAFEWHHVDADQGCMVCPECHGTITETQRLAMLKQYQRVDGQKTHKFSIMWNALESPFPMMVDGQRLPVIAGLIREFQAAQEMADRGDHGMMRQFWRDRFCRPYRDDLTDDAGLTNVPTRGRLAALSSISDLQIAQTDDDPDGDAKTLCVPPPWAEYLTLGVDVQEGGELASARLFWILYAGGDKRGAVCGYGTLACCPRGRQATTAELHASLDRLAGLIPDTIGGIPVVRRGVDTGNGTQTDDLLRWISARRGWYAIKGTGKPLTSTDARDRPGWIYVRQQDTYTLRLIETPSVTRLVHGELLSRETPPILALPPGLDQTSALIRHICATVEYAPGKWTTKRESREFVHREYQKRNDYCDALVYARALAYEWVTRPTAKPGGRKYGLIKAL